MYLALLGLGPTSVQEAATHADINRTTAYLAIESLKEHGLVSSYEEEGRAMLAAEGPGRLAELIDTEVRMAQEKQRLAASVIPELQAMYRAEHRQKPVVRYFEGEEGVRDLRELLAKTRTKGFDTFARLHTELQTVAETDEAERLRIVSPLARYRIIYVPDAGAKVPRFPEAARGRMEIRFAKNIPFDFDGEVGILDHVSYVASTRPGIQICVIESEQLSNLLRAQFELAWSCALPERIDFS